MPDTRQAAGRSRLRTILDRRDVAFVPAASFALVSLLGIVSVLLRGDGGADTYLLVVGALALVVSSGLLLALDHPLVRRVRSRVSTYVWIGVGGTAAVTSAAIADGGPESPIVTGLVLFATYWGLLLPRAVGRWPLALLLLAFGVVLVARPGAPAIAQVATPLILLAGWMLGRLGHFTHGHAARTALLLSRSDALTRMLNRRGFFEEFEYELARARADGQSLGLLVLDLDDFKPINDRDGHDAGDALLRWIGEQLPGVLPERSALGRLGGDEFAIALPGVTPGQARAVALAAREALAPRIAVSIGVACAHPDLGPFDADELVRNADRLMYAVKRGQSASGEQVVVGPVGDDAAAAGEADAFAPRTRTPEAADRGDALVPPPVSYAALRRAGGPPDRPLDVLDLRWLFPAGFGAIAVAGLVISLTQQSYGGDRLWDDMLLWLTAPWVALNAGLGIANLRRREGRSAIRMERLTYFTAAVLLGGGIGTAMLAGDHLGLLSPIIAGLYLKVIFDGYAMPRRDSQISLAIVLAFWLVTAVVGPPGALWVAPLQLGMFLSAHAIGLVAHRAFTDATDEILALAGTDALTGLRNRAGWDHDLREAFEAATGAGRPLTVLAFDLDAFKHVNDRLGHDAGDELLRAVAERAQEVLPDAASIARTGGDEFAAILPVASPAGAAARAAELAAQLDRIVGASVGHAVYPADGRDLTTLLRTADARSYAAKRARRAAAGGEAADEPEDLPLR